MDPSIDVIRRLRYTRNYMFVPVFQLAKKYNMVIVSSILERDDNHGEILANTAGEFTGLFPFSY